MWICVKCRESVEDQYTVCPHCGAARSAGRFSREVQPRQTPKAQYVPEQAPSRSGRGFIALGSILAALLFFAFLAAAVFRHAQWADALFLFLRPAAAESETPGVLIGYVLYGALSLLGAFLAALPGLWTVGLGKMLRKLGKIEKRL